MRQMQNNFRRSISVQQALQEAKNQSTIIRSTPKQPENPPTKTSDKPIESKTKEVKPIIKESIVEEVKPIIEEPKIEEPKVEQPKTTTTTTQTSRLPNLGK